MTDGNKPWSQIRREGDLDGGEGQLSDIDPKAGSSRTEEPIDILVRVPGLLFSRRWWWATLLVIGGMLLMSRLGIWQLERLDQRRTSNAQLVKQLNAPPLDLSNEPLPSDLADLEDRLAVGSGQFDFDSQVLLTQQSWQGRPGVHLITPLLITGLDAAILIDRGWVPARDAAEGDLARFNDESKTTVEGVIKLSESISGATTSANEAKSEWYRVDIAAIESQLPYQLIQIYIKWLPQDSNLELPYREERQIDLSEGSHLSYAIQWFSFTVILGVGYIVLIIQQERRQALSSKPASSIIEDLQE